MSYRFWLQRYVAATVVVLGIVACRGEVITSPNNVIPAADRLSGIGDRRHGFHNERTGKQWTVDDQAYTLSDDRGHSRRISARDADQLERQFDAINVTKARLERISPPGGFRANRSATRNGRHHPSVRTQLQVPSIAGSRNITVVNSIMGNNAAKRAPAAAGDLIASTSVSSFSDPGGPNFCDDVMTAMDNSMPLYNSDLDAYDAALQDFEVNGGSAIIDPATAELSSGMVYEAAVANLQLDLVQMNVLALWYNMGNCDYNRTSNPPTYANPLIEAGGASCGDTYIIEESDDDGASWYQIGSVTACQYNG